MNQKLSSGKIILSGEHFVVYGNPALAIPTQSACINGQVHIRQILDKLDHHQIEFSHKEQDQPAIRQMIHMILEVLMIKAVKLDLWIDLDIQMPLGRGMGASAALCLALSRGIAKALNVQISIERLIEIAEQTEKIFHGRPSGVDHTVIAYEKTLFFRKNFPPRFVSIKQPLKLLIVDSLKNGVTKEAVHIVYQFAKKHEARFHRILQEASQIVYHIENYLSKVPSDITPPSMSELFYHNQELLKEVGVDVPETKTIIQMAREQGVLGAKISGAGLGGIVAICGEDDQLNFLANKYHHLGLPTYLENLTGDQYSLV